MAADPAPQVSVIIPHHRDVARLQRCLAALLLQVPPDGQVEVLVVDNGAPSDLSALSGSHPALRLLSEPRPGAALARNCGLGAARAPLLFFLDSDCVPAPDWLARGRHLAAALPGAPRPGAGHSPTPDGVRAEKPGPLPVGLIGGRIEVFDEGAGPRSGAAALEIVLAFDTRAYARRKGFAVTANLLTSRAVIEATGLFRPGLSEDMDWCHRARAQGFALHWDPDLVVGHPARADWPALRRKWRRLTEESFALRLARPGAAEAVASRARLSQRLFWAARALILPASALAHSPRVVFSPRLGGLPERLRALGALWRLRLARTGWMLRQAMRGQVALGPPVQTRPETAQGGTLPQAGP